MKLAAISVASELFITWITLCFTDTELLIVVIPLIRCIIIIYVSLVSESRGNKLFKAIHLSEPEQHFHLGALVCFPSDNCYFRCSWIYYSHTSISLTNCILCMIINEKLKYVSLCSEIDMMTICTLNIKSSSFYFT